MCWGLRGEWTIGTRNLTDDNTSTAVFSSSIRTLQNTVSRRRQGQAIGQQLRDQFETLLAEPLPDHLLQLLNELEKQESDK